VTRHSGRAWSYRDDPAVPDFDDSRPLFVFDGHCELLTEDERRRLVWLPALASGSPALHCPTHFTRSPACCDSSLAPWP
jgi:hypothetical protein